MAQDYKVDVILNDSVAQGLSEQDEVVVDDYTSSDMKIVIRLQVIQRLCRLGVFYMYMLVIS